MEYILELSNFHLFIVAFIFIAITGIIATAFFFYLMINSDRKAQKIRTENNKKEHNSIVSSLELLTEKIESVLVDNYENRKILKKLLFEKQLEENNTDLEEKFNQALSSINYDSNNLKTARYKKMIFSIFKVILKYYKELRASEVDILEIEKISEIVDILKTILLTNNFSINATATLVINSEKLLTEFNFLKNKKKKGEKGYKSNSDLIARKARFIINKIYEKFPEPLIEGKNNSIKVKGNENNTLQDIQAETINITWLYGLFKLIIFIFFSINNAFRAFD